LAKVGLRVKGFVYSLQLTPGNMQQLRYHRNLYYLEEINIK